MPAAMLGSCMDQECEESLSVSPEEKLVCRAASGDAGARLQLVKAHLDFVVELTSRCTSESGLPFSQTLQMGISSIIRAADGFCYSHQMGFRDHVSHEFTRAIEGMDHELRE